MSRVKISPLTPTNWLDFERLFGPHGACGGCWCMYWKLPGKKFKAGQGNPNRLTQKRIVVAGQVPGLLAYIDGVPNGWVAVEPRKNYPVLNNSRILKPLDDLPVWSVVCFFISRNYRNRGLTVALLEAAIDHVAINGGKVVEGYPVEPKQEKAPPAFLYTGLASAFRQAGFTEAARRSDTRPIMRYFIQECKDPASSINLAGS